MSQVVSKLTILYPEVDINLVQHIPHAQCPGVCQKHQSQIGWRLVKVQLVLGSPVAYEGVIVAPQLAGHVAKREDGAEDELGVV